jgi:bifunctional non-homologous end joining protein LigD
MGAGALMARSADAVVAQLGEIEDADGDGDLRVGGGRLHVSSLGKVYFPESGITKGDVMRYYATVSPYLLPLMKDRPLVLKRYPDGIAGPSFFQQNAAAKIPPVVRTASVAAAAGGRAARIIGGDLATLLYTVQIGTIAVHPWQSRTRTHQYADTTTIDLDPGDDVPFAEVVGLARRIKVVLDKMGLVAAIKTSGSSGLHIVLPLPPKTAYTRAAQIAEQIAERVVDADPERATTERTIRKRPRGSIYVDAMQNAEGKSVVAAYSVREHEHATVSAPLEWRELRGSLRIDSFTLATMPLRLRKLGDLWGVAMKRRNSRRAIAAALDG